MRWFRGWLGSLRLRLFGLGEPIRSDDGPVVALIQCTHPQKSLTACTYQMGPKGKPGWFMQCRNCGAWFEC